MRRINALIITMAIALPAQALTSAELSGWVTAMPEIKGWLDAHEDRLPEQAATPGSSMDSVVQQGLEQLRAAGLYNEFDSLVRAKGFTDVERWSGITSEITRAYIAVEMDKEAASMNEMQAQLQQVRNMPGMPEEQRQAMVQMLESSLAMFQEAQAAPVGDKELVRSRLEEVRNILDAEAAGE